MNILYLCDEYPPGQHGGIGTAVRLLARQVAKMGHHVVVAGLYTPGYGGDDEFEDEGIKVYRFRWSLEGWWSAYRHTLAARAMGRVLKDTGMMERHIKKSLLFYQQQLEQLITRHRIDLIEMPDYQDYIRFCRHCIPFPVLSVPVVVKMHGSLTYINQGRVAPQVLQMEQAVLKQAAAVSGVSHYMATKSAQYLAYPNHIKVLHNGIAINSGKGPVKRDPLQVIFTGSLVAGKGIYQLAQAWNLVNKQFPDARLLILGKGDQRKVRAYLNTEAEKAVFFKGHVNASELLNELSASAIAVFPSYSEAFSLAPLEAMVNGAAVIYTSLTSGPELIDNEVDGLLVDPAQIDALAAAILRLLNEPDTRQRLAANAMKKIKEQFEISRIAEQNIGFYKGVLTAARSAG